jgi:nicotinamide-nucleotide amidase
MDDVEALAVRVGTALKAKRAMLVTAESCTGGWVAQAVTAIAGSSDWFERGFVTYSNASKIELLGVRDATLEAHGAVSEATATEMARGALRHSRASVSVAVTGVAGPSGGSPEKPVGTVWFAWSTEDGGRTETRREQLPGDREAVRLAAVRIALEGVVRLIG